MTSRPLSRLALAAAATALVLGACGSSAATQAPPSLAAPTAAPTTTPTAAPTPTPAPTAAPTTTPEPTAAPAATASDAGAGTTAAPTDTPAPSDAANPSESFVLPSFSFPSEDKELEGRLPSQVNGTTLTKLSFSGATFMSSGSGSQQVQDLLTSLGKTPGDMSVAVASDDSGTLKLQLGAFRVRGAPTDALLNGFIAVTKKDSPESTFSQATVGGKNVTAIVDPTDTTNGTAYIYATGDTLFYVVAADPAVAAAALVQMP